MKYFEHKYNGSFGEIWGLFAGLSDVAEEEMLSSNKNYDYSHTEEIIKSAMNGNFSCQEEFNLKLYEIKCSQTDRIEISSLRKKYLTIVDTINGNDNDVVGYGEISANDSRLQSIDTAFDVLENDDQFERCLAELYSIRKSYIVEKGVDPVEMLLNSLKGVPEAISSISELVSQDNYLKGIIEVLCENSFGTLRVRLEG